jgi:hypothetical protein
MPKYNCTVVKRPSQFNLRQWKTNLPKAKGLQYLYCSEVADKGNEDIGGDMTSYLLLNGKVIFASLLAAGHDLPEGDARAPNTRSVSIFLMPGQEPEKAFAPLFSVPSIVDSSLADGLVVYDMTSPTFDGFIAGCKEIEKKNKDLGDSVSSFFAKYRDLIEGHLRTKH